MTFHAKTPVANLADINECIEGISNCSIDAVCNNTKGSYNCTCRPGYSGNGQTCKGKIFAPFRSIQIKINSRWFKSVERSSTQKNIPFNRRRVAFCKNHFQLLTVKTSLRSFINIFVHTIINEPVVPLKKSFGVSYCKFVIFLLSHLHSIHFFCAHYFQQYSDD